MKVFSRDFLLLDAYQHPLEKIFFEVCRKYCVSETDMKSRRKSRYVSWPRQEFYYRAQTETRCSLPEIGRFLGGRDHTTVMYGIQRHKARQQEHVV